MEQRLGEIAMRTGLGPDFVTDRILRGLADLSPEKLMKLFDDFETNLQNNRHGIRNPSAYLMGMATRVRKQGDIRSSGAVMAELSKLFQSGVVYRQDMDDRCIDMLRQLPEERGLQALAELRSVDMSTVKNMSAFFMALMKKYTVPRGEGGGKGGGGSFSHRGAEGRGWEDSYDRHSSPRGGGVSRDEMTYHHTDSREQYHHSQSREQYDSSHHGRHDQYHPPHRGETHATGSVMGDAPAPRTIPSELLYGYGADEYIPEIPRPLEGSSLPPLVQEELESSIDRGILDVDDLDNRIMKELRALPPHVSLRVAKDFANLDKSRNVRSVSGFLMGIVKKHAMSVSSNPSSGNYHSSGGFGDGKGSGGREHISMSSSHSHSMHQESPPSRRQQYSYTGGDDRYNDRYVDSRENDRDAQYRSEPPARSSTHQIGQGAGLQFVDMEIDRLVSQGLFRHDDIDDRAREFLAAQESWMIKQALSDFSAKDMGRINNKGNFLKGMIRKLLEAEGRGAPRGGTSGPHGDHQYNSRSTPYQEYYPPSRHHHGSTGQSYPDPYSADRGNR